MASRKPRTRRPKRVVSRVMERESARSAARSVLGFQGGRAGQKVVKNAIRKPDSSPLDGDEFVLAHAVSLLTEVVRFLMSQHTDSRELIWDTLGELENVIEPLRYRLGSRDEENDHVQASRGGPEPAPSEGLARSAGGGDAEFVGWSSRRFDEGDELEAAQATTAEPEEEA